MNKPATSVRALLCCLALSVPMAALAAKPIGRSTYTVESGDTLDKVIRKTMPNSPLRSDILRNAFVQQNPQAFTKAPPRALMAGAVLNVPNHDELLRSYLGAGASGGNRHGYNMADMNDRKNWVRYP